MGVLIEDGQNKRVATKKQSFLHNVYLLCSIYSICEVRDFFPKVIKSIILILGTLKYVRVYLTYELGILLFLFWTVVIDLNYVCIFV